MEIVGQIGGATYAVAVAWGYAYLGVGPRLVVVDITDPSAPRLVGQSEVLSGVVYDVAVDVAVAGRYAYVAAGGWGLRVVDISDPKQPREVNACKTRGPAEAVVVVGRYAYVAAEDGGLVILRAV